MKMFDKKCLHILVLCGLTALFIDMQSAPRNLTGARQKEASLNIPRRRVSNKMALSKERTKIAQRDEGDIKSIEQVLESKESDRYTQSEAHMHLGEMRKLINDSYNVAPYLNVISTAIANEAKFKDTHYVFYHTTPNQFRLM